MTGMELPDSFALVQLTVLSRVRGRPAKNNIDTVVGGYQNHVGAKLVRLLLELHLTLLPQG
jgi:hypothetical protein